MRGWLGMYIHISNSWMTVNDCPRFPQRAWGCLYKEFRVLHTKCILEGCGGMSIILLGPSGTFPQGVGGGGKRKTRYSKVGCPGQEFSCLDFRAILDTIYFPGVLFDLLIWLSRASHRALSEDPVIITGAENQELVLGCSTDWTTKTPLEG